MRTLAEAQEIISRSIWCPNSSWTVDEWNSRVSEFLSPSDAPYEITKDRWMPEEMGQPGGQKCLLCGKTVGHHYQQADGMLYCVRAVSPQSDARAEPGNKGTTCSEMVADLPARAGAGNKTP